MSIFQKIKSGLIGSIDLTRAYEVKSCIQSGFNPRNVKIATASDMYSLNNDDIALYLEVYNRPFKKVISLFEWVGEGNELQRRAVSS